MRLQRQGMVQTEVSFNVHSLNLILHLFGLRFSAHTFSAFSLTGPIYFLLSSDPLCPQMPSSRGEHLRIAENHIRRGWVTVSQEQNKNGGELTQAEIAKFTLHVFKLPFKYSVLLRVNPFKEVYIFMFAF